MSTSVILYGFGAGLGLPDISPFCSKVETYLRMADIPFEKKAGAPIKAPKKKLPYIEHSGHKIGDSSHIIAYLAEAYPNELHFDLTPAQRATATFAQTAIEEGLYFGLLYSRWQDDATWALYKDSIGGILRKAGAPGLLIPLIVKRIRKGTIASLRAQGTGRHTPEEVTASSNAVIDAIAASLGDQAFFFGDAPHALDATVFSFIDGIITPPLSSPTQTHTQSHDNLVQYVHRIRKQYYAPESA